MIGEFDKPVKAKQAFYEMASRAEQVNRKAKLRFQRPPYYMYFLESWTTKREDVIDE